MFGHTPILPCLIHFESVAALLRGGEKYRWCDFSFFLFYSLTCPQTKRAEQIERKMAQKIWIHVSKHLLGGKFFTVAILWCFTIKTQKFGVGTEFSMQMRMLNISKSVTDRNIRWEISPHIVWGANRNTCCEFKSIFDLEPKISRCSVFWQCAQQ